MASITDVQLKFIARVP